MDEDEKGSEGPGRQLRCLIGAREVSEIGGLDDWEEQDLVVSLPDFFIVPRINFLIFG